jgi:hypothetical protein
MSAAFRYGYITFLVRRLVSAHLLYTFCYNPSFEMSTESAPAKTMTYSKKNFIDQLCQQFNRFCSPLGFEWSQSLEDYPWSNELRVIRLARMGPQRGGRPKAHQSSVSIFLVAFAIILIRFMVDMTQEFRHLIRLICIRVGCLR